MSDITDADMVDAGAGDAGAARHVARVMSLASGRRGELGRLDPLAAIGRPDVAQIGSGDGR